MQRQAGKVFGASVRVEEAIGRLGAGREGVVFLRAGMVEGRGACVVVGCKVCRGGLGRPLPSTSYPYKNYSEPDSPPQLQGPKRKKQCLRQELGDRHEVSPAPPQRTLTVTGSRLRCL